MPPSLLSFTSNIHPLTNTFCKDCKNLVRSPAKLAESGEPENGKMHEIIIKDNGIGFNSEYADQVFVIFQRLNDKQEFPGTGIGLALCRKITDNHGGVIFAKSVENKGTEFHVILPERQN